MVDAKVILEAMAEIKRTGITPLMEELEATEPDLASFLMEELSLIHKRLLDTSARHKQVQRLQRQVTLLVLVAIRSLRKAHHRLWQEESEDSPLGRLDPDQDRPQCSDDQGPPAG
jgi:hypothetical protein